MFPLILLLLGPDLPVAAKLHHAHLLVANFICVLFDVGLHCRFSELFC